MNASNGGFFKEVSNEQARAKIGAFGSQGSGKTTTLALLAIGLSKTYHNGAPVAMQDSENGSDYLKPIFDAEGIKLMVRKSGAFADMVPGLREAEKIGCCVFVMDSVTHTWREVVDAYCSRKAEALKRTTYDMQFQDWKSVKQLWAQWTFAFLNSPLHCLIAGRAGNEYEYQTNEDTGKKELIKGATKLKAENEFGYEPSLLIELESIRQETNKNHKGGSFLHVAYVLKDRSRSLNGKKFEFSDLNSYKKGDWQKVFKVFEPHFAFLNIKGTQRAIAPNTSEELFDDANGDTEARKRYQSKKIALEEIENIMGVVLWPGTTTEAKKIKLSVLQTLFGVRSWSAVETKALREIENGLWSLHEYERAAIDAHPDGEEAVIALLRECAAKVNAAGYVPGNQPEPGAEESTGPVKANLPPFRAMA